MNSHTVQHHPDSQLAESPTPRPVVVGIDGSQAAVRAARWAVEEVAGTAIPLRLVYCAELPPGTAGRTRSEALETAESAVRDACIAVEALGRAVKVDVELVEGHPMGALAEASKSARLLCIGNAESGNPFGGGFGSTAAQLTKSSHCPVAVVRGEHHQNMPSSRSIVALVDGTAHDDIVLNWGFDEANRRGVELVLVTAYQTGFDLLQGDDALLDHDRRMQAVLDRYIAARGTRYPHVPLRTVTAFNTFLGYLTDHAQTTQLAIVNGEDTCDLAQLFAAGGAIASSRSDFSLLVAR